ncbi:MAG: SGNH/GDSL hydrolase family protein [Candidatus Hodarchaeota archaeon]
MKKKSILVLFISVTFLGAFFSSNNALNTNIQTEPDTVATTQTKEDTVNKNPLSSRDEYIAKQLLHRKALPDVYSESDAGGDVKAWRGNPTRILCIGDSVTAGMVSGGGIPYVIALQCLLGSHFEVINAGYGGTTSRDWVNPPIPDPSSTFPSGFWPPPFGGAYELLAEEHLPCRTVVVELGGNDATGYFEPRPIKTEDYIKNMTRLIDRLRGDGARRILILTPIPRPGKGWPAVHSRLLSYTLSLINHTWPRGVSVIDIYHLLDPKEDFEGLNCHPNEQGHLKIALAVAERVHRRRGWGPPLWAGIPGSLICGRTPPSW